MLILGETRNLALEPEQKDLLAACCSKLEQLISDEIGADRDTWVVDRPNLVGWPSWRGDDAAA
jgi:arylsulfatase